MRTFFLFFTVFVLISWFNKVLVLSAGVPGGFESHELLCAFSNWMSELARGTGRELGREKKTLNSVLFFFCFVLILFVNAQFWWKTPRPAAVRLVLSAGGRGVQIRKWLRKKGNKMQEQDEQKAGWIQEMWFEIFFFAPVFYKTFIQRVAVWYIFFSYQFLKIPHTRVTWLRLSLQISL